MRACFEPRHLAVVPALIEATHALWLPAFDHQIHTVEQRRPEAEENPAFRDHGAEHHVCHAGGFR
jgi:hypothetical protein